MEVDDGFFLPGLQPEISGCPTVVFIHSPVVLPPVVELAGRYSQPVDESPDANLFSDQRPTKSTTWSRTSCGTQLSVRVPQGFF